MTRFAAVERRTAVDKSEWTLGNGGFAKLYGPALAGSSLMDTSVYARWLFVFLLACSDREGRFHAQTVSTLGRLANIPPEFAEQAVRELEAEDPNSRSTEHNGRRIERIPGGWRVLNYEKYRDYRTKRQVYDAERKAAERKERGE
jgi:hypothetical protein